MQQNSLGPQMMFISILLFFKEYLTHQEHFSSTEAALHVKRSLWISLKNLYFLGAYTYLPLLWWIWPPLGVSFHPLTFLMWLLRLLPNAISVIHVPITDKHPHQRLVCLWQTSSSCDSNDVLLHWPNWSFNRFDLTLVRQVDVRGATIWWTSLLDGLSIHVIVKAHRRLTVNIETKHFWATHAAASVFCGAFAWVSSLCDKKWTEGGTVYCGKGR